MVLTKSYLRYEPTGCFGLVGSLKANVLFVEGKVLGLKSSVQLAVVPALEDVFIWDTKKEEKVRVLKGSKWEVTAMAISADQQSLAVGYEDGSIKIWKLSDGTSQVTLSGHRSAVSALQFDHSCGLLASGGRDTDVILWDVINESGLYRLHGHKGMVTQCRFLRKKNVLVTSSKDMLVKMWDLDTQHCFLTLVGHRSEVWGFVIANNESRLVTGCGDSELRVWKISYSDKMQDAPASKLGAKRSANDADLENESDVLQSDKQESQPVTCLLLGSVIRQSRARVTSLHSSNSGQILGCLGNDSQLELFKIATEEEINKSLQKKMKRARKKQRKEATDPEKAKLEDISITRTVEDEFVRVFTLRVSAKTKAFDLHQTFTAEDVKVLLLLQNNTIEVHNIPVSGQIPQSSLVEHVRQPGHRSDVRTISLSSDGMCVLSGSQETLKVWNRDSHQCIRTMSTGYALCSFFVPGDKHVIIGTKEGKIEIYDVAAGSLLESVEAHEGPVWSLSLAPDKRGFVSGSGDSTVKFWEFELITDENYSKTSKRLGIAHVQTLKLKEEVVCVKYSPNQKLLAVSLLDCTVKVFFADSLKFFLSLYGHKLPVMALDISSDSTLIITGSADKNIKIWGLDFGDCHKSIFAHDDGIMGLQFIANTHYFMSVSKDKTLKYWDADKFEQIMVLQGHQGEVWCLAVSPNGEYVVTGSHDKSLRLWQRTDEPLIIDEEREQEREAAFEETLAQGPEQVIPGENDSEARKAGKKTMESVKSAEQLMEAIELHREESAKMFEYRAALKINKKAPLPPTNPILIAFGDISSSRYVLRVTQKIRSSELEEALVVLPFDYVIAFLKLLDEWIKANWEIELSCRCLFFLMRIHHNQIAATSKLLPVIDSIRQNTKQQVHRLRFFLSLYGHKLPVMALDISSDSTLIITGSADKNIKIWGLDFGDCHKSIFAHDDGIMGLQFIANAHYFMSVSKDKTLKYWDADKFEQIMVLQGHQGEVWCLAVSLNGEYVVTGSHDKSLRLWQRTDEPLIIDEEREQEREAAFEETLAQGPEQVIPGENDSEARKAGKKTMENVKSAEQLMEAIELHREESAKMFEYRAALKINKKAQLPPTSPILMAFGNISSSRYVMQVTQKIRSSELEEALVVLPFDYVIAFLKLLDEWIKANWEIELSCRCLFFLMRIHHNQIAATSKLLPVIDSIRQNTKQQVHRLRDIIGFNQAGMEFLRQEMEAKEISFFTDATEKLRNIRKKRKTVKQVVI